ncbi:hypothetical protein GCM10010289_83710 [Streptomyces violascens]|uniref:Uncharacterized protein n=1 Tax=Streptomyces violascens TaxID=67381 RepID=A0ABQ3QSE9_9ACTN|nr:hypothetical protein GCM10010289_83710 [Streptomyces violascens]GHI40194.1 hypothetical protein Sviol_46020 [Streptomyces violascens]
MAAGESEVDQSAEAEGGGPVVDPALACDPAPAGQAAVAAGHEAGDEAFGRGAPTPVVGLPDRVRCGLTACGFLQLMVRAPGEEP